jgi:hypothetical protein
MPLMKLIMTIGPLPDACRTPWIRDFTALERLGLNGSLQQCR